MSDCKLCDLQRTAPPALDVYDHGGWRALIPPDFARPDCVWLMATDHVEGLGNLTPEQAAGFGTAVARVSAVLQRASSAERVYVVGFGENHPHVHVILIGRHAAIEPADRGLALVGTHMVKGGDRAAAEDAAARLRAELAAAGAAVKVE